MKNISLQREINKLIQDFDYVMTAIVQEIEEKENEIDELRETIDELNKEIEQLKNE